MGLFDLLALGSVVVAVVAAVISVRSARTIHTLEERLERLSSGKDGKSLEKTIAMHDTLLKKQVEHVTDLVKASEYLHRSLQASVRKVSLERYNPFPGIGGNLSFTLALLDAHNSGVVMTSLHNRDTTRVYAKAIRDGHPLQQLSEEEERVLQNAMMQKGA